MCYPAATIYHHLGRCLSLFSDPELDGSNSFFAQGRALLIELVESVMNRKNLILSSNDANLYLPNEEKNGLIIALSSELGTP